MESKYQEALDFLFSRLPMFSRSGAPAYKPGLDTSINLAEGFGNPHKKFRSIHIGGTNGKGSTSHLLASVLQSQGYKTALYTSPHLVDFRERIRINGKKIPEEKVVDFVEKWKGLKSELTPSFFELTMIMAFEWFAEENVDTAVIEVGMGGRLDSTNIITPILSVITNISHDHNQFLGDTLQQIAAEKAGIIKKNVPVVIGESQSDTKEVFLNKADAENAPIIFAEEHRGKVKLKRAMEGWEIDYNGLSFILPLGGDYQQKNIVTVLAAIEALRKQGFLLDDTSVKTGIENVTVLTGLAGRWMVLSGEPLVIADTGHNIAGISYNIAQLDNMMSVRKDGKLRIVIGFVADKAIHKILDLLPPDAEYYVTNAQIPRAMPAEKLIEKFLERGFKAISFANVAEAFEKAKKDASEKDIIFIGGSTFIVADFLHYSCALHGSCFD